MGWPPLTPRALPLVEIRHENAAELAGHHVEPAIAVVVPLRVEHLRRVVLLIDSEEPDLMDPGLHRPAEAAVPAFHTLLVDADLLGQVDERNGAVGVVGSDERSQVPCA